MRITSTAAFHVLVRSPIKKSLRLRIEYRSGDRRNHRRQRPNCDSRNFRQRTRAVLLGQDAHQAVHNAVVTEVVAGMALQTLQINPAVEYINQALLDKHYLRKHGAKCLLRSVS